MIKGERYFLNTNRTNGHACRTTHTIIATVAGIEVDAPSIAIHVEGAPPITAHLAFTGYGLIPEQTCGRQEDAVAVRLACYLPTVDAVLCRPLLCNIETFFVNQFLYLFSARHLPQLAPVNGCGILIGWQFSNIDRGVCIVAVVSLLRCLAPSKVCAVLFRTLCVCRTVQDSLRRCSSLPKAFRLASRGQHKDEDR